MFTCDDERTCDECYASGKFVGRKGNVVYCDNGSRPLCKTCNGIPSDEDIINALRTELAAWKYSAEQFSRNEDYYRGLVVAIGEMFGIEAKTSDDGSVQEDVLCAKVPELVAALRAQLARLEDAVQRTVKWADDADQPHAPWCDYESDDRTECCCGMSQLRAAIRGRK